MHKSHVPENEKQELSDGDGDEESKKKDKKKKKLLETQVLAAGSVVESLRVKEINYFVINIINYIYTNHSSLKILKNI